MLIITVCEEKEALDPICGEIRSWQSERQGVWADTVCVDRPELLKADIDEGKLSDIYILGIFGGRHGSEGIDLGNDIRKRAPYTPLIYVADSPKYTAEAYGVRALMYLTRPFSHEDFFAALQTAQMICSALPKKPVLIRSAGTVRRVNTEDILYVENNVRSMRYYLNDGSTLDATRRNLSFEKALEPLFASGCFVQTHKSFIINMKYISILRKETVLMTNGAAIPISRSHTETVAGAYEKYVGKIE